MRIVTESRETVKIGYSIPAIVRELVMDHLGDDVCPLPIAQRLADAVNDHLCGADWLQLSNGLTFDRAFDPSQPRDTDAQDGAA